MTAEPIPVIEIGGTHVTTAKVAADNWSVISGSSHSQPLRAAGTAAEILTTILSCANSVHTANGQRWGVALPGPFDYAKGIGLFEGVAKFEALYGVDVRLALLDRLRPPASDVVFINDADAFLLGEWIGGAANGHARASGLTLGTGVGSAFLADGEVISDDTTVPPEGRVDLLTIADKPLEETVSRRAILARYAKLAGAATDGALDVREIAERARQGESIAHQVLDEAIAALGATLAPWLVRFGATVLVVGGSMSGSWDLLAEPLRRGMTEAEPASAERITVLRARHPADAALIGAAWHARR